MMLSCVLVVLAFLSSCGNDPQLTASQPSTASPRYTTVSGTLRLFDRDGNEVSDRTGVTALLDSRTESVDNAGSWKFVDVVEGSHLLRFEQEGFGASGHSALEVAQDSTNTPIEIALSQPPSYLVTLHSAAFSDDSNLLTLSFSTTVQIDGQVLLELTKDDRLYTSVVPVASLTTTASSVSASALLRSGFQHGDVLHVKLYPLSWHTDAYSSFFDAAQHHYLYTALGIPSQDLTITIP